MGKRHVIVINVAGLSPRHLEQREDLPNLSLLMKQGIAGPLTPAFPALTCPVQASILTGKYSDQHGIVANGFLDRTTLEPRFWEQSAYLVQQPQIWDVLKKKNRAIKTAVLFWQNTLFANSDIVITPRPLHLDSGMIPWCYSRPSGLYEDLTKVLGEFDLRHYWGPMASVKSSEWITGAAMEVFKNQLPDLLMVYLPHLDYSSQKFGIGTDVERKDLREVDRLIGNIIQTVDDLKLRDRTTFLVLSEYSIVNVTGAVCLNRIFRREGLLAVREIQGKEYPDFEMSRAFAVADHQIAHVYVKSGDVERVRRIMEGTEGVGEVWGDDEKRAHRIHHERSGELVAVARPDRWFAYYWWEDPEKAPEFTRTVDIHRKPGYDPLDLFFDPKTRAISTDTQLIKGSHGILPQGDSQKACLILGGALPDRLERRGTYHVAEIAGLIERLLEPAGAQRP